MSIPDNTYTRLLSVLATSHSSKFAAFVAEELQSYQSPVLFFDLDRVRSRINEAKSLEAEHNCRFLFAVKACPCNEVLTLFAECGLGFDVSNHHELKLVEACLQMAGDRTPLVSATGPTVGTIKQTSLPQLFIHADCRDQMEQLAGNIPSNAELGLRVSTRPATYGHPANTTRFGLTPIEAEAVLKSKHGKTIQCLHSHRSGPKSPADVVEIGNTLDKLCRRSRRTVQLINLGGGSDRLTSQHLVEILKGLRRTIPRTTTIVFEFGSYWFAGSGLALGSIINKKRLSSNELAITIDISNDCHLRWSEPRLSFFNPHKSNTVTAHVFGPTCYEADYFGVSNIPADSTGEPAIQQGDPVLVQNVDIYSVNWNKAFNGIAAADVRLFSSY